MKKFAIGQKLSSSRAKIIACIVAGLLLLGLLSGAAAVIWYSINLKPRDASSTTLQLISIKSGLSADGIADLLEDNGIIRSSSAFTWYTARKGIKDDLKAGVYELGPQLSVEEIVTKLYKAEVARRRVRFAEARRLDQLEDVMIEAGYEKDAIDAALGTAGRKTLAGILPDGASLEGYLFAETYILPLESGPEAVIAQASAQLVKQLTPDVRAGIEAQGLTIHEAVTLASIIQQEASTATEQKQIAQIFLKRLDSGITLGSDVTTCYAVQKSCDELTGTDLNSSSPYNTRRFKGLPPGPIGNFGTSALQAVAFPADGDYLFFFAGADCITHYSHTNPEHESQIQQYGLVTRGTKCSS